MKTLIVYYSMFGNTHKIAAAITSPMGTAESIDLGQLTVFELQKADLLVMPSKSSD